MASSALSMVMMYRTRLQTDIKGSKSNRELMNRTIPDETPPENRVDWRAHEEEMRKKAWRSCEWCDGKLMIFDNETHPECDKRLDFMNEIIGQLRECTPIGKLMLEVLRESGFGLESGDLEVTN